MNLCCPTCAYPFHGQTAIAEQQKDPEPGDYTICFNCAEVLEYADDLSVFIPDKSTVPQDVRDMQAKFTAYKRSLIGSITN